jgi:SAM-dependent methyltransferase
MVLPGWRRPGLRSIYSGMELAGAPDQERAVRLRDAQAETYATRWLGSRGYFRVRVQIAEVLRALRLRGAHALYDAGAGVGIYTLAAARRRPGLRVLAADLSPASIAVLRRDAAAAGLARVDARVGNIVDLRPPAASCDRALLCEVLQHIPDAAARRTAVANVHEALAPGGRAVAVLYRWGGWIRPPKPKEQHGHGGGIYRMAFTEAEARALFSDAGFARVRVTGLHRSPDLVRRKAPQSLGPLLERLQRGLGLNAARASYLLVEAVK